MARRRSINGELNVWPAFVDVLATLLLVIILLVLAVTLTQFYTANRASGLERIGDQLSDQLEQRKRQLTALQQERESLIREGDDLRSNVGELTYEVNTQSNEIDELQILRDQLFAQIALQADELNVLKSEQIELTNNSEAAEKAVEDLLLKLAEIEGGDVDLEGGLLTVLGQMDDKLERLLNVLSNAERERTNAENQRAAAENELAELDANNFILLAENEGLRANLETLSLSERLNDSLLIEAEELGRQRSAFFANLIEVLGERDDVSVVGDRFVFQSEVLFDSGSARLGISGEAQLTRLAETIMSLASDFPSDWILRVDGHTDARPISTSSRSRYQNNWQLSSERARSVVESLIAQGVPPNRLVAAGFGEHQPLIDEETPEALAKNRRIELKLTTR